MIVLTEQASRPSNGQLTELVARVQEARRGELVSLGRPYVLGLFGLEAVAAHEATLRAVDHPRDHAGLIVDNDDDEFPRTPPSAS